MIWLGKRSFNLTKPARRRSSKIRRQVKTPEVSNDQARKTALVVATVLLLIALWNFYRGRMVVVGILGGVAAVLTLIGLLVPVAARGFHRFWMGVAGVLGYINSRILLSLLYYGVFFPYGLVSRLLRDPLNRRRPRSESYWVERPYTKQTQEQFERLF